MSEIDKRKVQDKSSSLENEILVLVTSCSDQMHAEINQLLSIWGMTELQYDALRVLSVHDESGQGLASGDVGKLLQTRVPDVTRLLDRLSDKGWLTRERDKKNRRVVLAKLTQIGRELVESIFAPLQELQVKQLSHMNNADKLKLKKLLDIASFKD